MSPPPRRHVVAPSWCPGRRGRDAGAVSFLSWCRKVSYPGQALHRNAGRSTSVVDMCKSLVYFVFIIEHGLPSTAKDVAASKDLLRTFGLPVPDPEWRNLMLNRRQALQTGIALGALSVGAPLDVRAQAKPP